MHGFLVSARPKRRGAEKGGRSIIFFHLRLEDIEPDCTVPCFREFLPWIALPAIPACLLSHTMASTKSPMRVLVTGAAGGEGRCKAAPAAVQGRGRRAGRGAATAAAPKKRPLLPHPGCPACPAPLPSPTRRPDRVRHLPDDRARRDAGPRPAGHPAPPRHCARRDGAGGGAHGARRRRLPAAGRWEGGRVGGGSGGWRGAACRRGRRARRWGRGRGAGFAFGAAAAAAVFRRERGR